MAEGRGEAPKTAGRGSEPPVAVRRNESLVSTERLMEEVCERENVLKAAHRVKVNGGAPGVDGMRVYELEGYLRKQWRDIREQLLSGTYKPQPVRRVEIPKPDGGVRKLGIPTVVDRFVQQAVLQVLQPRWDLTFSEYSYGFRPERSAHHAVAKAQRYQELGYSWVVDIDLEKFLDAVSYYTPFHGMKSNRVDCASNTLIRNPLRLPRRRWTASSSPRFTRCNTV